MDTVDRDRLWRPEVSFEKGWNAVLVKCEKFLYYGRDLESRQWPPVMFVCVRLSASLQGTKAWAASWHALRPRHN